jgi:hypothetical protein
VTGLAAVAVAIVGCSVPATSSGVQPSSSPTSSSASSSQTSSSPTAEPSYLHGGVLWTRSPAPAGTPAPGTVLLQGSGSAVGSASSPSFVLPGTKVSVTYHYNCALKGDAGYFQARLVGSGSSFSQAVVSAAAVSGSERRTVAETVRGPGTFRVVVRTDCPWQVSVATA